MCPFFYFPYLLIKIIYYYIYEIKTIMANGKYININYPFKDSHKGFFLDLNDQDNQAIKADLLHLILTRKGQRLYKPDFGTDLLKFIFEPEDGITLNGIKEEITKEVKTYLPQLQLDEILIEESPESEYAAVVTIKYTITDTVFETADIVVIKL
jgi:phage baseplate assembly protein W